MPRVIIDLRYIGGFVCAITTFAAIQEGHYASCCSAEETIDFYKAMGFRLSEHPIPSCVEDEPFDIQMECRL